MSPTEIQNRKNQVNAAIEQMEVSEIFNEMEKRDQLSKLKTELESLELLQIKNIDTQNLDHIS